MYSTWVRRIWINKNSILGNFPRKLNFAINQFFSCIIGVFSYFNSYLFYFLFYRYDGITVIDINNLQVPTYYRTAIISETCETVAVNSDETIVVGAYRDFGIILWNFTGVNSATNATEISKVFTGGGIFFKF